MKIENTEVFNFEGAFRGMRNPMNSWDRGDSYIDFTDDSQRVYIIGEKDMKLATALVNGGTEHRKFLRQIMVCVDITAPLYWWKEFDTYKVGTTANSTSTMHKVMAEPFHLGMFEFDDLPEDMIIREAILAQWIEIVGMLNEYRDGYLALKEEKNMEAATVMWKELIRLLPSAWLQTRTITMNYENLMSMYYHRRNHKLTEWHQYCDWIESLPYTQELFLIGE